MPYTRTSNRACPGTLYKYVGTFEAAKEMLGGSLKFCAIDELNDPMDALPWFNAEAVRRSLEELRAEEIAEGYVADLKRQEVLLQQIAPELQVFTAPDSTEQFKAHLQRQVYNDMPLMQSYCEKLGHAIRSKVGVLSLTEKLRNFPMWAHYANRAQGACVALTKLDEVFLGDGTGVLNVPLPVSYDETRPTVTFRTEADRSVFLAKLSDWAYECEWRIARRLMDCVQVTEGLYVHRIPTTHISDVYCGWNMPTNEVDALVMHADKIGSDAKIWRVEFHGSGSIKPNPVNA